MTAFTVALGPSRKFSSTWSWSHAQVSPSASWAVGVASRIIMPTGGMGGRRRPPNGILAQTVATATAIDDTMLLQQDTFWSALASGLTENVFLTWRMLRKLFIACTFKSAGLGQHMAVGTKLVSPLVYSTVMT